MMKQKRWVVLYIVAVLSLSWLISIIFLSNPDSNNIYAAGGCIMFIPALCAFVINILMRKSKEEKLKPLTARPTLNAVVFSLLFPTLFIIACVLSSILTGLGSLNPEEIFQVDYLKVFFGIEGLLFALVVSFGEEYGWRGFLLPELTKFKGKTAASVIVGFIWGIYHFPAIYLLSQNAGMQNPLLVASIQGLYVFTVSFAYAFCQYNSNGSILPVILMHSVWNTFNPVLLGSIYFNTAGIVKGDLLLINGEGVIGLIIGLLAAVWFIIRIKKDDSHSNSHIINIHQ